MKRSRATRSFAVLTMAAASVLAASALLAAPPARAAGGDVETILRASGAAQRLDALATIHTVHLRGTISIAGVPGTADGWQDVHDGRFAQYAQAGPVGGGQGFDGTHSWSRDLSGFVWDDGSVGARDLAIDQAYLGRYALWTPDRGGAMVTSSGQKVIADRRYDVLQITPKGGSPFELWIDATSHLPARTITTIGPSTTTVVMSDYRSVMGLRVPFVQKIDGDGNSSTFSATSAEVDASGAASALQRPVSNVTDFSLPAGTTSIPFELVDNHVALDVMLDGKGPFRFLFDTGGENIVDVDVAKQLGLGASGSAAAGGVGATTEAFQFATIDRMDIGGAVLRKQIFAVAPVHAGFGMASSKPIDGLIGFEVLARFVTTFDYGSNHVVLRTPAAGAAAPTPGTTVPFVFNGEHPMIDCAIAGVSGSCQLDTGSRIALTVLAPFLAAHPAIVPPAVTEVGANGFGVGGASLGRLGRTTLQLAGFTIPDVVADLSTATRGAFADPYTAGNVGAGVLKRFAVTFDYTHETVTFAPDANFGTREAYDRSGTFLVTQGGKIVLADVRPGTPAAKAGLSRGEVLTSVGGNPAAGLGLGAIRTAFGGPAGTTIPLVVTAKDGTTRNVMLTLADYV